MQPIYCTWNANGAHVHTPGLFRRGRVTDAKGWINSALGTLAYIFVHASDGPARNQTQAWVKVSVPSDARVEWDAERRELTVIREHS